MFRLSILLSFILYSSGILRQTPLDAPLPEKFNGMQELIRVNHFPSPVLATPIIEKQDTLYLWKHNTSVLSEKEDLELMECGAYIFYNNQWNLRASYAPQFFIKNFNCPKATLKRGQVYTFVDNWRTDARLRGGWAMWYFIAKTSSGEMVFGLERLDTVGEVYAPINFSN